MYSRRRFFSIRALCAIITDGLSFSAHKELLKYLLGGGVLVPCIDNSQILRFDNSDLPNALLRQPSKSIVTSVISSMELTFDEFCSFTSTITKDAADIINSVTLPRFEQRFKLTVLCHKYRLWRGDVYSLPN